MHLRLPVTPELFQFLSANMLYKPHVPEAAQEHYYVQLISNGRVFARYQYILGSRELGAFSADELDAWMARMSQQLLAAWLALPASRLGAPSTGPRDLAGELALLQVLGTRVTLPAVQLAHYARIKTLLETAGATYRQGGFDFPDDVDVPEVLAALIAGKVVNPQKDFQFFATPAALADDVCLAAGPLQGRRVLEPSAGDGALARRARELGAEVTCAELWDRNVTALKEQGFPVHGGDFLSMRPETLGQFDVILANPPFAKGQDLAHVQHMWQFLRQGGVLSVLTSQSWREGTLSKQVAFRRFLEQEGVDFAVKDVPPGTFAASGTQVGALHLVLRKPCVEELA